MPRSTQRAGTIPESAEAARRRLRAIDTEMKAIVRRFPELAGRTIGYVPRLTGRTMGLAARRSLGRRHPRRRGC